MKLRDLEYLVALHELKHFRKAAERCFVSQPTLSGQIRKLEEDLGISLLERDTRNLNFTPAGEDIVKHAKRVLDESRQLKDVAHSYLDPMAGEIRIGLIPTVAPYLLPRIMPQMFEAFPRLQWQLVEQQTRVLMQQLKQGELDAVILAWLPEMQSMAKLHLYDEPLCLAMSAQHPMTEKSEVHLSDLDGQRVLMLEDGHCLRDQALGYCFSAGANEDNTFRATSLETLRHMVATGRGLTLLPYLSIQPERNDDWLQYRQFADAQQPTREIALVFRRGSSRIRCLHGIAERIKQHLPSGLMHESEID